MDMGIVDIAATIKKLSAVGISATLTALTVLLPATSADAHGWGRGGFYGRPSVGVYFGGPVYRPWGYGYGYGPGWGYYGAPAVVYAPPVVYSPPVVVQPQQTWYIERGDNAPATVAPVAPGAAPQAQSLPPGFWYYCRDPGGYYPTVQACRGGWEQVAPQPR